MTRQLGVPELLDRNADENEEERDAYHPHDNEGSNDIGPSLEIGEAENAVIHHQETKLSPDQVEHHNKELGHQDDIFEWNGVRVKTHAT
jgi:hypothetical protein